MKYNKLFDNINNMADDVIENEQTNYKCSFSLFSSTLCGPSVYFPNDVHTVLIKECNKDTTSHFRSLQLGENLREGELICHRVGIFTELPYLSVCPAHRFALGLCWKKRTTCAFPTHSGKAKVERSVNSKMSYAIMSKFGSLIPVGSAICKKCRLGFSESLSLFSSMIAGDTGVERNDITPTLYCQNMLKSQCVQEPSTSFTTCTSQSDGMESKDTDMILSSQSSHASQSSQFSSWSEDNMECSLDDINKVFSSLTKGQFSPVRYQVRKDLSELQPSTLRSLKRKASATVRETLDMLAPQQSEKLLRLITPDTSQTPPSAIENIVIEMYNETADKSAKHQLLSLISGSYTKKQLQQKIPGLSTYAVDMARKHQGKGLVFEKKAPLKRERMDKLKMDHALDFFFDPMFHQISSFGIKEMKLQSGEMVTIPLVVRTAFNSTMVNIYQAFCHESDFTPLSRSTLFKILASCPASKQTNLKGLDNTAAEGNIGFDSLLEVVLEMEKLVTDEAQGDQLREWKENLQSAKLYMKTDYKVHIQCKDHCADHCIQYALSDPSDADFQTSCTDHTHDIVCDRCELLPSTVKCMKEFLDAFGGLSSDAKEEMMADIDVAISKVLDWKSHIVRTVNQDQGRSELLHHLKSDEAVIVMDWAMKFLPMAFREKQSDWYAQKGINWHVAVCIIKSEETEGLKHRTFTHCMESAKQDWYAVACLLEHVLKNLKEQIPRIKSVYLRSDNAGCYHCSNLWLSLPGISERTGLQIRRYDFSEAQSGKSYCDAKIAHMRGKIRKSVSAGNDVLTAADMKAAIDDLDGVSGCQAANVDIPIGENSTKIGAIKGISKINNVEFMEDGQLRYWRAFKVGSGKVVAPQVSNQSIGDVTVYDDFKLPSTIEGHIRDKVSESDVNSFGCPEMGCISNFNSFDALQSHCLIGNHQLQLQQASTYDKIKLRWYDACMNLSEKTSRQTRGDQTRAGSGSVCRGWALKKDRKVIRFSVKVKEYLQRVFSEGEKTGRKSNPSSVAKNMRVVRNEEGDKVFRPSEYLSVSQITSYFSRLATLRKVQHQNQHVDVEDIEATVNFLQRMEVFQEITANELTSSEM